ncbi:Predicted arabinose efflux permease, MFS family [Amycolatopsis xylanica]|uniref:Predicted arabinose efflux permease, MFS family n=1 Tax=Amycolatopsis xylanica TaxID=589385 RepID=A0A1H3RK06_9PSEU|nr:MFS transporter [Amycolatopsis xylanica]SDZ25571.1 Predicted arabinose efflux permease, MFS family [Amycolatopsis xylanica]
MSGFGSYRALLRTPGAPALAFWGVAGRFPMAMRSIGCLLLVSAATGSLADAGAVAAALMISQGFAGPLLGRLADRLSQRRILLVTCLLHALGMTSLVASIVLRTPLWPQLVIAVATGLSTISMTSFLRARWTALVDHGLLRTAYALESVLDEMIFLLGPLLVTLLASAVHPAAGLLACAALTTVGSVVLALHTRSEPAPGRGQERVIGVPGLRVLVVVYAGIGFLLGSVDVTMIAFARERSAPGLAGVFLALTALGSLSAGLFYGAKDWRLSQSQLLSVTACALTLGVLPLGFAGSPVVMAILAVVAGVSIAPVLIAGNSVLKSLSPQGSLAEGFSWLTSAEALGIALGAAVAGRLAELGGFAAAVWTAAGGGVVALGASVAGQPALRAKALERT